MKFSVLSALIFHKSGFLIRLLIINNIYGVTFIVTIIKTGKQYMQNNSNENDQKGN